MIKWVKYLTPKTMNKKILISILIVSIFLIARLPAIQQIYHQDEYKWAMQADPVFDAASPHPPLGKYTLRLTGNILGFKNLRFAPLFFDFLCLGLVCLVIKKITNKNPSKKLGTNGMPCLIKTLDIFRRSYSARSF